MNWVFGDKDKNMPIINTVNKMIERLKEPLSDKKIIETKVIADFGYTSTFLDLVRSWKFQEIPTVFVEHELKLLNLSKFEWLHNIIFNQSNSVLIIIAIFLRWCNFIKSEFLTFSWFKL